MQFAEAFKLALQSLWANKLRTVLTLIGVVMGVASVIMVITLVNGANTYVGTKLSGYGADVFTVDRMSSVIFDADDYFRYQKRKILRIEDYQAVRDQCRLCTEVGALLSKTTNVVFNGHSSNNTEVRGYTWTTVPITWRNRRTGEAKLKIKEMGSRYLFICLYVWLEKYFSRGDYKKK